MYDHHFSSIFLTESRFRLLLECLYFHDQVIDPVMAIELILHNVSSVGKELRCVKRGKVV